MSEGKKTAAYEICEQLGIRDWGLGIRDPQSPITNPQSLITNPQSLITNPQSLIPNYQPPDAILIPVGDGCIIGGVHKGLRDLTALGWIERMPRLIGVQATGCAPLVDAWERGLEGWEMQPVEGHSVADSIVAGLPRDRIKALRAVRETGGAFVRVSDEEILAAIPTLARSSGVFAEPAAAAACAGLIKAVEQGLVKRENRVVVLATGSGLKDVAGAMQAIKEQPAIVEPTLEAVRRALSK